MTSTRAAFGADGAPARGQGEVLIVDDTPANLNLLDLLLKQHGYLVRATTSPELALQSAWAQPPDLIILDVCMPAMDGFEVCRQLKADTRTHDIPVIFVSGLNDQADRVRGLEVGGVDFISKPLQREEIVARVKTHMALRHAMQDLNQQKRSLATQVHERTQELLVQRNKAQGYLDIAGVMLIALDLDGRITMINRYGAELLGQAEASLIGLHWAQHFVPALDRALFEQQLHALRSATQPTDAHYDLRIQTPSGATRILSWNNRLMRDDAGQAVEVLSSAEDVTEQRAMELALRASEEKYRHYVENVPDGIFIVNHAGECLEANPAACALVGWDAAQLQAMHMDELIRAEDLQSYRHLFHSIHRYGSFATELRLRRQGLGEIRAALKAVLLGDERVMIFCTDVSELRRVELRAVTRADELNTALKQLQNLSAHMRDSIEHERLMVASDIHDQIGASLTGARLMLNQLHASATDLPGHCQEVLTQVRELVSQALASTRGVYTRLRPPMLDDLGLVETCRWYLQDWSQKSHISVSHQLGALDPEPSEAIRVDVFRILQELLTNVARHSGATQVRVSLSQDARGWTLLVKDNGQGFDASKAATGFGLLGIKGRLNRHHGQLVTTRTEGGMSVSVQIPRSSD